jgi:hypothetical protein
VNIITENNADDIGKTNYIQRSTSWAAVSCAATQELPNIFLNTTAHYHIPKSPPWVPTLSQINLVHITSFYFSMIRFNIIQLPTSWSS